MDFASAVAVGALQGVLEWLPVSSQGQLTLVLVGVMGLTLEEALRYSIWVHLGTLAAAVVYFRRDLRELSARERRFLLLATGTSAVVGAPLYLAASRFPVQQGSFILALIGGMLIMTGVFQTVIRRGGRRTEPDGRTALVTGIAQGFSALPGVSRSGTTTGMLLLQNFKPDRALRLSFLLSIPLVLVANVFLTLFEPVALSGYSLVSAAVAFVTGLLSIGTLLRLSRRFGFGWVCILLGGLSLVPFVI